MSRAAAAAIQTGAGATAGSEGAAAGASTRGSWGSQVSTKYYKGMLVFTITKGGLMYQAVIEGQEYSLKRLNQDFAVPLVAGLLVNLPILSSQIVAGRQFLMDLLKLANQLHGLLRLQAPEVGLSRTSSRVP